MQPLRCCSCFALVTYCLLIYNTIIWDCLACTAGLPCLQCVVVFMSPCLQARAKMACRKWLMQHLLPILCAGKSWGSRGGLQEMDDAMMELLQEPAGRQLQTGELNMQDMMTEEKMQVSALLMCDGGSCCMRTRNIERAGRVRSTLAVLRW